jgi:DeoR family transcriptional regulator, aga operon transcriptional repressor
VLAQERRRVLIEELHLNGQLITSEMAGRLGVSEVTLRSDLDDLERQGRVRRTHGGAVATDASTRPVDFDIRLEVERDRKSRIASAAAAYVDDNETVVFDAGTTVHYLAQHLPPVHGLTVVTPAMNVAGQLLGADGVEVQLMGGRVDPTWLGTIGTPREQGIKDLIAQKLFLGAQSIDDDLDITDVLRDQAANKIAFLRKARVVILLVDSTKWHRRAPYKVAPVSAVDVVIVDDGLDEATQQRVRDAGVELVIA